MFKLYKWIVWLSGWLHLYPTDEGRIYIAEQQAWARVTVAMFWVVLYVSG